MLRIVRLFRSPLWKLRSCCTKYKDSPRWDGPSTIPGMTKPRTPLAEFLQTAAGVGEKALALRVVVNLLGKFVEQFLGIGSAM
jgi:hypothetical protein